MYSVRCIALLSTLPTPHSILAMALNKGLSSLAIAMDDAY